MQSVEGKWETRMANLGGIKVECVEIWGAVCKNII